MIYAVTPNLSVIHSLQCAVLHWTVTWRVGRAWINATVLKTVEQQCSVGSNPTLSSIHGPLVKWLRHYSFTASTVGSIPPRVTIRHLYTAVKDRTHHGCLVVCTTQQLRISLQVKQRPERA